jgi:alkaline phosphatase D
MKQKHSLKSVTIFLVLHCIFIIPQVLAEGPHQATGIKIGEVTHDSAIVWTRLTRDDSRVGGDAPLPVITYNDPDTGATQTESKPRGRSKVPSVAYPNGTSVETIEGAVPGANGDVRVAYRTTDTTAWKYTPWEGVDPARDFTRQFTLSELSPGTGYAIRVESRDKSGNEGSLLTGSLRTAPAPSDTARVLFTVTTGQRYPHQDAPEGGFRMYNAMLEMTPSFFVHTGDILYYDDLAKTEALAYWHWQRMYSLPTNVQFHRWVPSYFIKDDHDTWLNDCWPSMVTSYMGDFTFAQGLEIFREQVPMGEKTYRTIRWGEDLQIWLVEGRDFRSANTDPDGPDKTIWGEEQKAWFKRTVLESDATFRVLISPMPIVGPDRSGKKDNHSNAVFAHEGNELRAFMAEQPNLYVICGDRHWQYVSVDAETSLREYSCGPASDEHAGGWNQDNVLPEHEYLNVTGGYLSVEVDRKAGEPFIAFRHHSVDGELYNEDIRNEQ